MKKLIILILLSSLVFGQCQDYIRLAEERLAPPYPNYFGAANEYIHAAECYEKQGASNIADSYYEKAASHYIQAAELLVEGGDYYQKAKSYEFAADSFFEIGDTTSALRYYDKAKEIYLKYGYPAEASALTARIADRFGKSEAELNIPTAVGVVLVVLALGIFLFARRKGPGEERSEPPKAPSIPKPRAENLRTQGFVKRSREDFKSAEPERPKEEAPRAPTPREKLARKLREKYTPK